MSSQVQKPKPQPVKEKPAIDQRTPSGKKMPF